MFFFCSEDDHGEQMPLGHDGEGMNNEENQGDKDNGMDTEINLPHIPGADDTTLLSNVSDEFVLPPISTAGKIRNETMKKQKPKPD